MTKTKLLFINLGISLGLILLVEILVRMFVPQIQPMSTDRNIIEENVYLSSPGLKSSSSGLSMGKRFSVNDEGFWKYSSNDTSKKSMLILGDSVTMGIGVEPDSTFIGRLAYSSDSTQFLNTSLIGYNSFDYKNIISSNHIWEENDIDLIVIFWCLNDLYPDRSIQFVDSNEESFLSQIGNNSMGFIREYFFTYQWLKKYFFDRPKKYYKYDSSMYHESNKDYNFALDNIQQIKRMGDSLDIEFSMFLLPYEYQIRNELNFPQDLFSNELKKFGIDAVNLYPYFKGTSETSEDFFLYGDGIHFSNEGHSRVFKVLAESKAFISNE